MQNRYVGDVGDYVKLAILRQLAPGRRLGVAWWLFPNERHNNDGGHREYLGRNEWRHFDSYLFDALVKINNGGERDVRALEDPDLLPNAVFARDPVPSQDRRRWLADIKSQFKDRDLIFLDPDNGIAPPGLKATQRRSGKSVLIEDLEELRQDHQTMMIYHHQTRFKGGHLAELRHLAKRLSERGFQVTGAFRAKPWSPRALLMIGGDNELCSRARDLSEIWLGKILWYPKEWLFSEEPLSKP
jgi:hypothetical protein